MYSGRLLAWDNVWDLILCDHGMLLKLHKGSASQNILNWSGNQGDLRVASGQAEKGLMTGLWHNGPGAHKLWIWKLAAAVGEV